MFRLSFIFGVMAYSLAIASSWQVAKYAVEYFETETENELQSALRVVGEDWARVKANGLRVELSGLADNEIQRFQVLDILSQFIDTSRIDNQITVIASKEIAPPRFSLEILRSENRVQLIGLLPDDVGRETIVTQIEDINQEMIVTDMLETAAYPIPRGWDEAMKFGLESLAVIPRSKISITEDSVEITAVTDSVEQQNEMRIALLEAKPENIDLEMNVSAPRPVITPFRFHMKIDADGPAVLACSADTEEMREKILMSAVHSGVSERTACNVGLGVPTTDWAEAVALAIDALTQFGEGSVSFTDADISLVAGSDVSKKSYEQIVGQLEANLPDLFSLTAYLTPKVLTGSDNEDVQIPELFANVSLDGGVFIGGRLNDSRAKLALTALAEAEFGSENVTIETIVDDTLPVSWTERSLVALQALSLLKEGKVTVQPDVIAITGRGLTDTLSSDVGQVFASQLGGKENYDISVRFDPDLLPKPDIIAHTECETQIQSQLALTGISFEPGSYDIDGEDSRTTIKEIAKILRFCPEAEFEIQGHTDSQGRDELNLAISQARADAVLGALLDERLLIKGLIAKGYGSSLPIASNETEDGRELNRRIEFILVNKNSENSENVETAQNETDDAETDDTSTPE